MTSIIVPVYDDSAGISQTLDSLLKSCKRCDRRIYVIDNGSTDDTRDVIQSYTADHDNVHLLVEGEIQGSYAARNKGIEHADGDVLAFLDADETVDEDWLDTALEAMKAQDVTSEIVRTFFLQIRDCLFKPVRFQPNIGINKCYNLITGPIDSGISSSRSTPVLNFNDMYEVRVIRCVLFCYFECFS